MALNNSGIDDVLSEEIDDSDADPDYCEFEDVVVNKKHRFLKTLKCKNNFQRKHNLQSEVGSTSFTCNSEFQIIPSERSSENDSDTETLQPKSKKRKKNKFTWKQEIRKSNRNSGKPYISSSGKNVPARLNYDCKCKNKCTQKLPETVKLSILEKFNDLGSKNVQDAYIFGLISISKVERRRPDLMKKRLMDKGENQNACDADLIAQSKRNTSLHYKVVIDGQDHSVCKMAFSGLHGIKFGRVDRIANAKKINSTPPLDKRGTSQNSRSRKLPNHLVEQIKTHINSFPVRISHYTRKKSTKKYLSPDLSIRKMHLLYVERYEPEMFACFKEDNNTKFKVSYEFYAKIFNTNFNLSFGKPKTDVCNICDKYKNQIEASQGEEKVKLKTSHRLHLTKANKFYEDLKNVCQNAKTDGHIDVVIFDYQQNLPVPILPIGEVFYKRQLWVYNQCFYSGKSGLSSMYMYDETIGKKGANETVSFLKHYIDNNIDPSVTTLYIFTDNCVGQNKNLVMVEFLSMLTATGEFTKIIHRFPERGHSFLPCDRKFGLIEKEKKKITYLYLPEEWMSKVLQTSKTFKVINVLPKMIKDYRSYLQTFFKKTFKNFTITKYKSFSYEKKSLTVSMHHNIENAPTVHSLFKESASLETLNWENVKHLYQSKLPINPKKLKNMQELSEYVPQAYHEWYRSLEENNAEASETEAESDDED